MTDLAAHPIGTEVRIAADITLHDRQYRGRAGRVTEVFPYDGGVGYHVTVIEGVSPVAVLHDELEVVDS